MKNTTTTIAISILLAASHLFAGEWFIAPTTGIIIPSSSSLVYHGMNGTTYYNNGYSIGLQAGRYLFNNRIKLYGSYDYNSFYAKQVKLQTPFGEATQSNSDLYHSHAVMLNADYIRTLPMGLEGFVGLGAGANIDGAVSPAYEGRIGVSKDIGGRETPIKLSVEYSYRVVDGEQKFGKKSDGSYSIVSEEPGQSRIVIKFNYKF